MGCKALCYALRGAVTLKKDDREEMIRCVGKMYEKILECNKLSEDELAYIHFSQTKDLRSMNAASALRASGYASSIPLFCTQEADVEVALDRCVRVLILVNHEELEPKKMVYLGEAQRLRPDLKG